MTDDEIDTWAAAIRADVREKYNEHGPGMPVHAYLLATVHPGTGEEFDAPETIPVFMWDPPAPDLAAQALTHEAEKAKAIALVFVSVCLVLVGASPDNEDRDAAIERLRAERKGRKALVAVVQKLASSVTTLYFAFLDSEGKAGKYKRVESGDTSGAFARNLGEPIS